MCLLICHRADDGSLILAANRDERFSRATSPPRVWPVSPRILAGRDELAGGTWLAVNAGGVVAAVTNRPGEAGERIAAPSRGRLPLLACGRLSAAEARADLTEHLPGAGYNGFNLLVADAESAFVVEQAGTEAGFREVPPGWHVVGNGGWDDPADPRVARAAALLGELLPGFRGRATEIHGAVERLMGLLADHHPPAPGDAAVSPLCVHGPVAGTVSATILSVDPDRKLTAYLHVEGPPCREEWVDLLPTVGPALAAARPEAGGTDRLVGR